MDWQATCCTCCLRGDRPFPSSTKAGIPFSRINPWHARKFAEATGKLAKTDQVDAVMLARMGALLEPRTSDICNEQQSALQELAAARRNLIRDGTALLNRQQNLQLSLLKRLTRYRLRQIADMKV
ncbi:transposase [Acetobacter sp. DsW_063]|uniref:IS110 family transposase n=1 Tax=Acetobacter sp. DsW_063 TaxID=1514894 RepID=UPI000A364B3C